MAEADFGGMEDRGDQPIFTAIEGLKLIKNSRGFNWEIKINEIDIERLEKINQEMDAKFGRIDG